MPSENPPSKFTLHDQHQWHNVNAIHETALSNSKLIFEVSSTYVKKQDYAVNGIFLLEQEDIRFIDRLNEKTNN